MPFQGLTSWLLLKCLTASNREAFDFWASFGEIAPSLLDRPAECRNLCLNPPLLRDDLSLSGSQVKPQLSAILSLRFPGSHDLQQQIGHRGKGGNRCQCLL